MKTQDLIGLDVEAPAPAPALAASIKKEFVQSALRSGAVRADVLALSSVRWCFHAEFDDAEKAAAYAKLLSDCMGMVVSMGMNNQLAN